MSEYTETLQIDINKKIDVVLNDNDITDADKKYIIDKVAHALNRSTYTIKEQYKDHTKCTKCTNPRYAEELCEKCFSKKHYDGNPHNLSLKELRNNP